MLTKLLKNLVNDTSGATAMEYTLIIALIALAIIGSVQAFAGEAYELWTNVNTDVSDAIGSGTQTPPVD